MGGKTEIGGNGHIADKCAGLVIDDGDWRQPGSRDGQAVQRARLAQPAVIAVRIVRGGAALFDVGAKPSPVAVVGERAENDRKLPDDGDTCRASNERARQQSANETGCEHAPVQ